MCVNLKTVSTHPRERKCTPNLSCVHWGLTHLLPDPTPISCWPVLGVPEVPWGLSMCQTHYSLLLALSLLTAPSPEQRGLQCSQQMPASAFLLASAGHVGPTPPGSLSTREQDLVDNCPQCHPVKRQLWEVLCTFRQPQQGWASSAWGAAISSPGL